MRDTQLDHYRALMMMHVIIGHVMYWLYAAGEPYLSFVLFAMAGTFFIAGASVAVNTRRRSLWGTVVNRIGRVVIPFYIYAVVVIVFTVAVTALFGDTARLGFKPYDFGTYGWKDIVRIVLCEDVPGAPFGAHIWFLQPYLILSCTFPLQVWLTNRCNRHMYMAACLVLFLAVQAVTRYELLREVACYNVFMIAGYLYYRRMGVKTRIVVGLCAAVAIVANEATGGHFCPMQGHKFPPDWMFVMYNLFVLCLIALVVSHFTISNNRFFRIWSERGYNIYLYQSVVFAIVHVLRQKTYCDLSVPVRTLLDAGMVLILSTGLSYLTYPIERFVMKKLRF